MAFPKQGQQLLVANRLGVKHHTDDFIMPSEARSNFGFILTPDFQHTGLGPTLAVYRSAPVLLRRLWYLARQELKLLATQLC